MKTQQKHRFEKAKEIFHNRGRALKTAGALSAGIHPRTLYGMEKSTILEKRSRGLKEKRGALKLIRNFYYK